MWPTIPYQTITIEAELRRHHADQQRHVRVLRQAARLQRWQEWKLRWLGAVPPRTTRLRLDLSDVGLNSGLRVNGV